MIALKRWIRMVLFRLINWISRRFFASRLSFSHIEAFLYYNTPKKFFNFVRAHWDMWRGAAEVRSYPYLFVFEVTNVCNLKCPFCLTGKGISGGREVKHMSFEEARDIIDQVGDYIYLMQLYTWGEPLLNKDIYDIIDYAKSKNIYVMISTNATVMSPRNNQRLIDSGLDYVMAAIDGNSQQTYEQYRVGGDIQRVMDNLRDLIEKKKAANATLPFIEWQFIVFRHNEHEVEAAEKLAYDMGINKFTPLPAYVENPDWLPKGDKYRVEMFNPERLRNCDRPWTHLNVRADGGVASCCYEFEKKDDFGALSSDRFAGIWNNAKFRLSRKMIYQKRKGLEVEKSDLICYDCLTTGIRPSYVETPTDASATSTKIRVQQVE